MKILYPIQNNNKTSPKTQKVSFGAGLTAKMIQEIKNADVLEISNRLAQKGIPSDFKGNKVVAWCCNKTIDIFQQFNHTFRQKLALPKGIYLEDFKDLHDNPNAFGTCNLTRSKLRKNSDEEIPAKVIFFNTSTNWNNIDEISDLNFKEKTFSTDFFLYPFLHEFSHVIHEENLLRKFDGETLLKKMLLAKDAKQIEEYQQKYGHIIKQICNYALTDPLEAVACDMPRTILDAVNKNTLLPTKSPFVNTPYENFSFWQIVNRAPKKENSELTLSKILKNFWNGKFER